MVFCQHVGAAAGIEFGYLLLVRRAYLSISASRDPFWLLDYQPSMIQTQVWLTLEQEANDQRVHVADDLHNQPLMAVIIVPCCH